MAAGATYEPIATTTLGAAAATITFNSIPSTYTDLKVVLVGGNASSPGIGIQFNGDTATNYSCTRLFGNGTTATSDTLTSQTYIYSGSMTSTTGIIGAVWWDIFSYAGSTYKTCLTFGSDDRNGSGFVRTSVGLWRSTSAINSLTINNNSAANFTVGTTATIWGIKAA